MAGLAGYAYDRNATLGGALRAWMAQNDLSERDAGGHLQRAGVRGAERNLSEWLNDRPAGDLMRRQRDAFVLATGIDLDRLVVIEAKRNILDRNPGWENMIGFDSFQHRQEYVDLLGEHAKMYGGAARHIAAQIGLYADTVHAWLTGGHLPVGKNLELLIVGIDVRGILEVTCIEDYFLHVTCREAFDADPKEILGVSTFKEVVDALFACLGNSVRAEDKTRVFGCNVSVADGLRKWEPGKHERPVRSVVRTVRAYLVQKHPDLVDALDRQAVAIIDRHGYGGKADHKNEDEARDPVPAPEPPVFEPAAEAMAEQAPEPVMGANETPSPSLPAARMPETGSNGVIGLLEKIAPNLREILDLVGLKNSKAGETSSEPAPSSANSALAPFSVAIGEVVDGLEHCLGPSGYPDFGSHEPTKEDTEKISRILALMRGFFLCLSGLSERSRWHLALTDRQRDVEELAELIKALRLYADTRRAEKIILLGLEGIREKPHSSKKTRGER